MPQLDEKQYAHFNQMLEELAPEIDNLDPTPQGFVRDQIERNKQYGERTLVSPKQLAWLERLHEEFIGNTDHKAENKAGNEDGPDPNDPRFH